MYNLGLPVFALCGMMLLRGVPAGLSGRSSLRIPDLRPEGDISDEYSDY